MKEKLSNIRVVWENLWDACYDDYVTSRKRSHVRVWCGWWPPFSEFVAMTMSVSLAVRVMMCFAGKLRCRNFRFFYHIVCHRACLEVSSVVTRVLEIRDIIIIIIIIIIKAQRFSCFSRRALLIRYSVKNFRTIGHILSITAFCMRIYWPGRKFWGFRL